MTRGALQREAKEKAPLDPIERAIEDFRAGRMVIVVDDEDRENEGDLVMAAEKATAESVNFIVRWARGILCAPMSGSVADRLELRLMTDRNTAKMKTPFTVSVDAVDDDRRLDGGARGDDSQAG